MSESPEEFDYFGELIGGWNIVWNDHLEDAEPRRVKSEWIFSRVLDGTAVQDIFIVPSREESLIDKQLDAEYGTTLRIFKSRDDGVEYILRLYGRGYPTDSPKGRRRNYPDRKHDREDEVCILWYCDFFFSVEKRANDRKRRVANRGESNGREKIIQMNL